LRSDDAHAPGSCRYRRGRWRITNFLNVTRSLIGERDLLQPVRDALKTLEKHADRVIWRWLSTLTNVQLEGMDNLFQATRLRHALVAITIRVASSPWSI
jgi:hypothetical protein